MHKVGSYYPNQPERSVFQTVFSTFYGSFCTNKNLNVANKYYAYHSLRIVIVAPCLLIVTTKNRRPY